MWPARLIILGRLLWISLTIGAIAAIGGYQSDDDGCDAAPVLTVFLYSTLAFHVAALIVGCAMHVVAERGTLSDSTPRKAQDWVVCVYIWLQVGTALLSIFGLLVLADSMPCSLHGDDNEGHEVATILVSILVALQLLSACWMCIVAIAVPKSGFVPEEHKTVPGADRWKGRCHRIFKGIACCTCGLFGGVQQGHRGGHKDYEQSPAGELSADAGCRHADAVYRDAAKVLWDLFSGVREEWLTPSDWVAGLGLVRAGYLAKKNYLSGPLSAEDKRSGKYIALDEREQNEVNELVMDLAYFSKYMIAIYGQLLYLYTEIFPPMGRCCCGVMSVFGMCCQCGGENVHGDNCFGFNHAAFSKWIELEGPGIQLVHADFEEDVCRTPYAILVDHDKKTVVLTLRGTISLKDCLTDALAKAVEFEYDGQEPNKNYRTKVFVHQGFYEAAQLICKELDKSRILHSLLMDGYESVPSGCKKWLQEQSPGLYQQMTNGKPVIDKLAERTRGYKLRLVGHSLGAGVASVLTMLLCTKFDGINLHCFAYSCPGAVFSVDFAESHHVKRLVTTCVLSDDLIPRTSLKSLEKLRNQVVFSLRQSKEHKSEAMEAILKTHIRSIEDGDRLNDGDGHLEVPIDDESGMKVLGDQLGHSDQTEMGAVGKIVHLARKYENYEQEISDTRDATLLTCRNTCCGVAEVDDIDSELVPRYVPQKKLTRNIKVSPTMALDHLPDRIYLALRNMVPKVQKEMEKHQQMINKESPEDDRFEDPHEHPDENYDSDHDNGSDFRDKLDPINSPSIHLLLDPVNLARTNSADAWFPRGFKDASPTRSSRWIDGKWRSEASN